MPFADNLNAPVQSDQTMPKKAGQLSPVTVAVVEDDPRIRRSLVATLELTDGVRCLGEFDSGEAALRGLPDLKPQVAIMDVNLPGMDGVECVRALSTRLPKTQILMLTVRQDTEAIFNA